MNDLSQGGVIIGKPVNGSSTQYSETANFQKKMKHKEKNTSKETEDSKTLIKNIKIILWMYFNNWSPLPQPVSAHPYTLPSPYHFF